MCVTEYERDLLRKILNDGANIVLIEIYKEKTEKGKRILLVNGTLQLSTTVCLYHYCLLIAYIRV